MPNYSYVINSTFDPMTFKDRISPFLIAKQEYDKQEKEYLDRQDKIDKFSYLEDFDDNSEAKQLYNNYVNAYNKSFDDFTMNGLSQSNKRSWLNVRRNYQRNIGQLEDADNALQEEIKRRQALDAQDPSGIYATDTVNLSIDNYLHRKRPNDYRVSGQKLYERGLQIGATGSSRIYSDPQVRDLTKYYQDLVQTQGYSPELLAEFSQQLDAIPEFQRAVEGTLKEFKVDSNLKGNAYDTARQSVVNGIINGSVYKKTDTPQQNLGVLTAAQEAEIKKAEDSLNMQAATKGIVRDDKAPNGWKYDPNADISIQKSIEIQKLIKEGKLPANIINSSKDNTTNNSNVNKGSSTNSRHSQMKQGLRIEWTGNDPESSDKDKNQYKQTSYPLNNTDEREHIGKLTSYDDLPSYAKEQVNKAIKDGNFYDYDYYYQPFKSGGIWNDTEATLEIEPRNTIVTNTITNTDSSNTFSVLDLVGE